MANRPQHSDLINFIEQVICVYQLEYLILREQVCVPNSLNPVYGPINSQLETVRYLVILANIGGFGSCDPQHTLSEKMSPYFPDAERMNARPFVELKWAAIHKCMVS